MSSSLRARITEVDYSAASPYDIAILIEQVFKDTALTAEVGPLSFVQTIMERYTLAVRQNAAPETYEKIGPHIKALRTLSSQVDEQVRRLENHLNGRV